MTKAQERSIERLRTAVLNRIGNFGKNEVKSEEIRPSGKIIFYRVECGMNNDEGTAAELFARWSSHVIIGPNGGYTSLGVRKEEHKRGLFNAVWQDVNDLEEFKARQAKKTPQT